MSTTLTETRSNKMIFNLLTPQGFLSLSDYGTKSVRDPRDSDDDGGRYFSPRKMPAVITGMKTDTRLSLGRLAVTANASHILSDEDIDKALERHKSGDWGEVGNSDWQSNTNALKRGERILSAYTGANGDKFWVITEADRSSTTVLMPSDY